MSTEELHVKNEFDNSNFSYQDYKDEEHDTSQSYESLGELTTVKSPGGEGNISVYLRLGNRILFCSGKYFYLEHRITQTDHQKEYIGIVGTCHTCGVKIKGSLKVSSNFICHLKARHPEVYQEFLKQKKESGTGARLRKSDRSFSGHRTSPYLTNLQNLDTILQHQENKEQLQRNILQFLIATNQPLSLVEDSNFIKLFENSDTKLKAAYQYEQMIKDDCKYKQLQLANFFNNSKIYTCLTSDAWTFGECNYLALSCHWIDENYQRQTALLACIRTSILAGKCLKTIQNDVILRYGFQKDYVVNTVTNNIYNYKKDFVDFGINNELLCVDYSDETEDCTLLKQMQENLQYFDIVNNDYAVNVIQLEVLRLNKIWAVGFTTHLDVKTKQLHQECMQKCFTIWQITQSKLFKESFETILNCSLTRPNLFYFTSLYNSLKQLYLNKTQLTEICDFLENPKFSDPELSYLEELIEVLEPLHAAFEFLDMTQNHFYGCFLPTLVTLKWKLTRLQNSKKLKYLDQLLVKLKEDLLIEFKLYFELNCTKSEAILAAITYPPVKTRFLMGLQDSVLRFNFQPRNFLLKYGKEFYAGDDKRADANYNQENWRKTTITASDFFDFGDGTENISEDNHAPNSLKLEIDAYLGDPDNTLASLQKYPTVKEMFFRYNTCIPSPSSVLRLFPLQKILRTSLVTSCTHEQFENYIFYQSHSLNK